MQPVRIALVGDYSPTITAHRAIDASMRLSAQRLDRRIEAQWLHTSTLTRERTWDDIHGIWCTPGSPYANTDDALWAIECARTRNIPFLGTCGGFQHALLEVVRHVLGRDAAHAELDPSAPEPLIAPLTCALVERSERIIPTGRGRFAQWYGEPRHEGFHCSFGLNPACESLLGEGGLEIVARGSSGEVRAVELLGHEFFVGTLFQPERASLDGEIHPLVRTFMEAASKLAGSKAANSGGINLADGKDS